MQKNSIIRKELNETWAHAGAVRAGELIFIGYCAGVPGEGIEAQIRGAFDEMERRLSLFGLSLSDVVQMDCLFRDVWNIPIMEKVIRERFRGEYPVRKSIRTDFAAPGGEGGLHEGSILFQADAVAYSPLSR